MYQSLLAAIMMVLIGNIARADQLDITSNQNWSGASISIGAGHTISRNTMSYSQTPGIGCGSGNYTNEFGNTYNPCSTAYSTYSDNFAFSRSQNRIDLAFQYNWLVSGKVLGLVFDFRPGNWSQTLPTKLNTSSTSFQDNLTVTSGVGNIYDLRVLLGSPVGNFLPYLTLGPSLANIESGYLQQGAYYLPNLYTPVVVNSSRQKWGYTAGAGVGYRLNGELSLYAEYLYSSYNKSSASSPASSCCGGELYPVTLASVKSIVDSLQIRVGYHF